MESTYTYVLMEVSASTFREIEQKMEEAGYEHAFIVDASTGKLSIDMAGIAVTEEEPS